MTQENVVDYIVIGAGSAGCVLANRLSARSDIRVALLEAGSEDKDKWLHIPVGMGYLLRETRYNWFYRTEADPGLNGRALVWPRGKVLGGSSSINGMVYIRGQHEDFERWVREGAVGWSWQDVLPYFRKHEDQQRGANEWHGTGGPITVGDRPDRHPLWDAFIAAAQGLGNEFNPDFNGAFQEGAGYYQSTIRRGRRVSAAVGYLHPILKRPNLRILTDTLVSRIIFEGHRATGICYRRGGEEKQLRCTREIVLCAGAINSPQLLLLSGIGPAADLQTLGIPVLLDSPQVGNNLQDHLQLRQVFRLNRPVSFNDTYHSITGKLGMVLDYVLRRSGPMAYPTAQTGLFLRSSPEMIIPDIQYHFNNFSINPQTGFPDTFSGMTFGSCQLRPESRGSIRLRSPNPEQAPRIIPNYLSSERDCELAVTSVKLTRKLAAQPSIAAFIEQEERPGLAAANNDTEMLEFARNQGTTLFHPVGTCRMGSDDQAVVDPQLRVRGVAGLRVADASIMPSLVSGNTNAVTFVIGEKASDMMLAT